MWQNRKNQSGSVLFYILIGIVLLAALYISFSRSSGTSTSVSTKAQAKEEATVILDYAQSMGNAVQRLSAKGCSDNQIGLNNAQYTTTNPNTMASCQVFDPQGGRVIYKPPASLGATATYKYYALTVEDVGSGSGSAGNDLVLVIRGIKKTTCIALSQMVGMNLQSNGDPEELTTNIVPPNYSGSYAFITLLNVPNNSGKSSGCITGGPGSTSSMPFYTGAYSFYYVLLSR